MNASPAAKFTPGRTRWIALSLLAVVAVAGCIRLGFWQLDRLTQRRAHNAQVTGHRSLPPINLNTRTLPDDLTQVQYRMAVATGVFNPSEAVALGSEARDGQVGVHLLVPLALQGSDQKIFIDRGWVPASEMNPPAWEQYNLPGVVTIQGRLDLAQAGGGTVSSSAGRVNHVNSVQLGLLSSQVSGPLLPVYLQAAPGVDPSGPPYASLPDLNLGEGPHLGYAIQWFFFALAIAVGTPLYLRSVIRRAKTNAGQTSRDTGQNSLSSPKPD